MSTIFPADFDESETTHGVRAGDDGLSPLGIPFSLLDPEVKRAADQFETGARALRGRAIALDLPGQVYVVASELGTYNAHGAPRCVYETTTDDDIFVRYTVTGTRAAPDLLLVEAEDDDGHMQQVFRCVVHFPFDDEDKAPAHLRASALGGIRCHEVDVRLYHAIVSPGASGGFLPQEWERHLATRVPTALAALELRLWNRLVDHYHTRWGLYLPGAEAEFPEHLGRAADTAGRV